MNFQKKLMISLFLFFPRTPLVGTQGSLVTISIQNLGKDLHTDSVIFIVEALPVSAFCPSYECNLI